MCINMQSMRKPFFFAPNARWMFFNVLGLDIIRQKTNDVKLQNWEEVLVIMRLVTKDNICGIY